ncbi:hypothetical protein GOODEAATRI_031347, partial [Goodea atripinnis]
MFSTALDCRNELACAMFFRREPLRALGDRWSKAGNQEAKSRTPGKRKECWPDPPRRIWRRLSETPQQEEQCPDGSGVFGGRKSWKTVEEAWSSPVPGKGSVRRRIQVPKTRRELYAGLWIYAGRAEMKCSVAGRYQAEGSP